MEKLKALNTVQYGLDTHLPGKEFDCDSPEEAERLVKEGAVERVMEASMLVTGNQQGGSNDPGPAAPVMNTRDKCKLVGECKTVEDLDKLLEGETRQTVIEAISRKRARLVKPE